MKKVRKTLTKIAAITLILCLLTGAAPLTAFADETRCTLSYDTFGIGEPIAPALSGRSDYDFNKIGNALNARPVTTDERYAATGHRYLDRELTQRASYNIVLTTDTTLYYKWVGPKPVSRPRTDAARFLQYRSHDGHNSLLQMGRSERGC